jgi:DNA-binding transcriptional regulator YiaG
MAGRHPFARLRAGMTSEAQAEAEAEAIRLGEQMEVAELRRTMRLAHDEIARTLQIAPATVTKIEKRADMYVGALRGFIEAMGGELEIVARFPDHTVKIKNFADIADLGAGDG